MFLKTQFSSISSNSRAFVQPTAASRFVHIQEEASKRPVPALYMNSLMQRETQSAMHIPIAHISDQNPLFGQSEGAKTFRELMGITKHDLSAQNQGESIASPIGGGGASQGGDGQGNGGGKRDPSDSYAEIRSFLDPTKHNRLEDLCCSMSELLKDDGYRIMPSTSEWTSHQVKRIGLPYDLVDGSPFTVEKNFYPSLGAWNFEEFLQSEPKWTPLGRVLTATRHPQFGELFSENDEVRERALMVFGATFPEVANVLGHLTNVKESKSENVTDSFAMAISMALGFTQEFGYTFLAQQQIRCAIAHPQRGLFCWSSKPDFLAQIKYNRAIHFGKSISVVVEDKPQGIISALDAPAAFERQACQAIGEAAAAASVNHILFPNPTSPGETMWHARLSGVRLRLHEFFFPKEWLACGVVGEVPVQMKVWPDSDEGVNLGTPEGAAAGFLMLGRLQRQFRELNPMRDYNKPISED